VEFTVSGARRIRLRPGAGAIPETMLQSSHFKILPWTPVYSCRGGPQRSRAAAPPAAAVYDCRLHVDPPNSISAQFCNSVALLLMNRQTKSGLPEFGGIKSKSAASWLVEV